MKNKKNQNIKKNIMNQIKENKIQMKSKWYFILGSFLSFLGLLGSIISATFLINLIFFLSKPHYQPNYQWRLQLIINRIPYWIPILTLIFIFISFFLLKKYDFSYKKIFLFISIGLIFSIIVSGFLMNLLGLNELFIRKGPRRIRQFYQRFNYDQYNQRKKFNFYPSPGKYFYNPYKKNN